MVSSSMMFCEVKVPALVRIWWRLNPGLGCFIALCISFRKFARFLVNKVSGWLDYFISLEIHSPIL